MHPCKPIIGLWAVLAVAALAQAPKPIRLATTYTPGSWLLYSISAKTTLTTRTSQGADLQATLTTQAEAQLHVLPGATTGNFEIAARFTKYVITVSAGSAPQESALQPQTEASARAAVGMKPALFRVANGQFSTLFRQPGAQYDQPVDMLGELVRNDELPSGPVTVGAQWTRLRQRPIPQTTVTVPLTLQCQLTALGSEQGKTTAAITVHAAGKVTLPPGSLPDSQELASKGLVPLGTFSTKTAVHSVYRVADGVLLSTTSQTQSAMQLQFIGPSPQAATSDSEIASSGTVTLEKILAKLP